MDEQKTPTAEPPKTDYSSPNKKVKKGAGAIRKKTPLGRKILDRFLTDSPISISERVEDEIFWPGLKRLAYNILMSSIDLAFWNSPRGDYGGGGGRPYRNDDYRDYGRYSGGNNRDNRNQSRSRTQRPSYDYGEIIFDSEERALDALGYLRWLIDKYDRATVADLLEHAELSSNGYTDRYHGWTNLQNASVYSISEGWVIDLPPTVRINTR